MTRAGSVRCHKTAENGKNRHLQIIPQKDNYSLFVRKRIVTDPRFRTAISGFLSDGRNIFVIWLLKRGPKVKMIASLWCLKCNLNSKY